MFDGGRKLSVGDCALFQAGNAPPFIGILRKVTLEKDTTKLVVNWLYRPADVKLAKGVPLEAAPNEIFYSFHKDEISAASLLHPCKVAFLRRGAELPQGVPSFVCRRVYDTANKCLWWLTDRDYTDEHQEEVDLLLERTKLEMQAAVQSGGPSPRALTGPTSSQQLKSSSEVVQNAPYSAPSKGKKRERTDQNLEPSKRERSLKSEDGESSPLKRERSMKPEEIASITDKDGGLLNPQGVERLVQLMQQDQSDVVKKSGDVSSRRAMLAGVVAATEREDCLSRFVQLAGLPMLDDWLQEAHKGKVGDGGSPKEGDKGVEELLLTLLRALDKLPVDLDALKTCSVGKSVNNLRSHKNLEIQKKARKLVDIWKKRVDAEMKLSGEVKSGSNHGIWYKQSSPDVVNSHVMKGGPTEVAVKSSGAFAGSAKPMSNGTGSGEGLSKSASFPTNKISATLSANSPSAVKREENSSSKLTTGGATPDAPGLPVKDEKSNSSSQSQSNGQTWASGQQVKGVSNSSWKEDSKNPTSSGAVSSKPVGSASRHPSLPAGKGLLGTSLAGGPKEVLSGKPLVWSRTATSEKSATSSGTVPDKGVTDSGRDSQHRLIVRIPNPGRSPARMSGGTYEQCPPGSRGMSPSVPERNTSMGMEVSDPKTRLQNGNQSAASSDVNNEARSSNGGGRLGSSMVDDREKQSTSLPSDGLAEAEKRGDDQNRMDTDRPVKKEGLEVNSNSGGFTQRGGPSETMVESEDSKKVELTTTTQVTTTDSAVAGVTAMEVDDQGISLLASVAASEISRTGAPGTIQDKIQPEVANVNQDHAGRASSDAGVAHVKEAVEKQHVRKEDVDVKDPREETPLQKNSAINSAKVSHDGGAEQGADGHGGPGDSDSKQEGALQGMGASSDGDTKDDEKRHFSSQEAGRALEVSGGGSGNVKSSLDHKGDECRVDEGDTKPGLSPTEPPTYNNMSLSEDGGPEVSGLGQDGKSAKEKEETSNQGKGSLSGIELNNGYGSVGNDFKVSGIESESTDEDLQSGGEIGQSSGRRGSESDGHKMSDISISFPEEDVLEVARQAAKEVEQMERWKEGKSGNMSADKEGQDTKSPGFKSSDSRDASYSDTGREHRWKPHSSMEKGKDDDNRKRTAIYSEDAHDIVSERMDQGSAMGSSGTGEGGADQSRCMGGVGERKPTTSVQDPADNMLDGGQEHKRRVIDGRATVRVPSFHASQMLHLPNMPLLTSPPVATQHVVKPAPRSLPGGEPTTPEQATETAGPNDGAVGGSDVSERPDFDLNEGFAVEESPQDDSTTSPVAPGQLVPVAASTLGGAINGLAAPVAIVTATKGPFVLPASPMQTKSELGWKGSAATSAFRPAEPRRTPERQPSTGESLVPDAIQMVEPPPMKMSCVTKKVRAHLDIDLNVADDRGFEEVVVGAVGEAATGTTISSQGSGVGMSSQVASLPSISVSGVTFHSDQSSSGQPSQLVGNSAVRPFLDLNLLDESEESGTLVDADTKVVETMDSSTRSNNSSSSQVTCRVLRDFDLNDGPSIEDAVADGQPVLQPLSSRNTGASVITQVPVLRRNAEVVNMGPWFQGNHAFPAVAVPAFSTTRAEPPYSVAAAAAAQSYLSAGQGAVTFNSDMYRASGALSSAPAVAFPSSTQGSYQYGAFPLAKGFPFASATTFATHNTSPYMDSTGSSSFPVAASGTVTSTGVRPPYLMGPSEVGTTDGSGGGGGAWGARPTLDLNAGPEPADAEGGREDGMHMRQTPMLGGQPSMEQIRAFRHVVSAGVVAPPPLKRKEPDGGWELYRSGYQQAWR